MIVPCTEGTRWPLARSTESTDRPSKWAGPATILSSPETGLGASWNFVLWGGLHGVYLIVDKMVRGGTCSNDPARMRDVPWVMTFGLVCLAWGFFRADTLTAAFDILEAIVTLQLGLTPLADIVVVGFLGTVTLAVDLITRHDVEPAELVRSSPATAGAAVAAAVTAIVVFSGGTPEPFIYFQF